MNRDDRRPGNHRPPHNDSHHNKPPQHDNGHHQPPHHADHKPSRPPQHGGHRPLPPHGGHMPPYIPPIHFEEERPDSRFVRALMNDYAGQDISELGAVLLYLYENMTLERTNNEIARQLLEISENEMHHFHILGEMIVSLGGDPEYHGEHPGKYFNAGNMIYPKTLKDMLKVNIQAETAAIQNYYQRVRMAPNQQIAQTLQSIIEDEKRHLSFFQEQYRRLFGR